MSDTEVETLEIVFCQLYHKQEQIAYYDAKTIMGPWVYLCEECIKRCGTGLGLGKGQKLIYKFLRKKDEAHNS